MKLKQLLSLALLVSAFAVAPAFAMDGGEEQPAATWSDTLKKPFSFTAGEFEGLYTRVKGMTLGNEGVSRFQAAKNLKLFWYGAGSVILARYIYDNLDNIKAALGLSEESEVEANEVYAELACGCDEVQDEEKEQKEEVCLLEQKEQKEETQEAQA